MPLGCMPKGKRSQFTFAPVAPRTKLIVTQIIGQIEKPVR
jgi:hypothetical protein